MAMIECFRKKGWGCFYSAVDSDHCLPNNQTMRNSTIQGLNLSKVLLKGCKLTRVRLADCEIKDSELEYCHLVNCIIKNSTLKDIKLKRCTIVEDTRGTDTAFEQCIIYNASLDKCNIEKSICFDSTMTETSISESRADTVSFAAGEVSNSKLRFCELNQLVKKNDESTFNTFDIPIRRRISRLGQQVKKNERTTLDAPIRLRGSEIVDCDIYKDAGPFDKCELVSHPLALRKFLPEIRNIIFEYAIGGQLKGSSLIAALRGDPMLYQEALAVLYRTCVVFFFEMHLRGFPIDINHSMFNRLQNLAIQAWSIRLLSKTGLPRDLRSVSIEEYNTQLLYRGVTKVLDDLLNPRSHGFHDSIVKLSITFTAGTRFAVGTPLSSSQTFHMAKVVGDLDSWLNVPGLMLEGKEDGSLGAVTWLWKAKNGGVLLFDRYKKDRKLSLVEVNIAEAE